MTRIVGTHFDVSEHNRAAAELERTRRTLAEAQRIAHLGSFEYITATQAIVWSAEQYRIFGLDETAPPPTYDELFAKSIHPEDAARVRAGFSRAVEDAIVYEGEHRILRPDGVER